jgi:hypothetical protein
LPSLAETVAALLVAKTAKLEIRYAGCAIAVRIAVGGKFVTMRKVGFESIAIDADQMIATFIIEMTDFDLGGWRREPRAGSDSCKARSADQPAQ